MTQGISVYELPPWGVLDSGFFLTSPAPPTHLVEATKLVSADLEMSR